MRTFVLTTTLVCALFISVAYSECSDLGSKKSSLGYAKNIEVECYIVTREQLSDLFNQRGKNITQLSTKELHHPLEVYFLVRVKNTGNIAASGMLHLFVPSCGYPFPVKIMKMPPKMDDYYDFVICADTGLIWPHNPKPVITYEWDRLDCYPSK